MRYLVLLGLLGAFLSPSIAFASEDMDSFVFGDEPPVETIEAAPPTETMPIESAETTPLWEENFNPQLTVPVTADMVNPPIAEDFSDSEDEDDYIDVDVDAAPMPAPKVEVPEEASEASTLQGAKKRQDLTDALKNDAYAGKAKLPLPKVEGTWVDKITSSNPLDMLGKGKDSNGDLQKMVDVTRQDRQKNRKSNASVFDISGVMLRMTLAQVDDIMRNRGFQKVMQKYQVPNFIKWRNEEHCRITGVTGYERTQACVLQKAKKDKHQYVQTARYAKYDTKEEVVVTFTSNFTENKVYKIQYTSQASNITGNSQKAIYLRNIKIFDFWKKINQKYGKPDDKEAVTWGLGSNKPYLKAQTGKLTLEDPMLRELDYTRMSREDQRYLNTDLYSF